MIMMVALYGIIGNIGVKELKFWEIVQIYTRKLELNRITHIFCSFQVMASFSQISFP